MATGLTIPSDTIFSPSERGMWTKEKTEKTKSTYSESEINEKYNKGERRVITEINREKLINLVNAIDKPDYLNIQPLYQRRKRWDDEKKSRLIESFLMNIPVLPIVLYEVRYNSYEVIDGQQRLTTLHDFYHNKFKLIGLDFWTELNDLSYSELPSQIKAGIDRRSISTITLITESAADPEEAALLKQIAFERINTGGVKLSKQEVRNCLLSSDFNDLLFRLSRNSIFTKAWGIPSHDDDPELIDNNLYKKMEDIELILRFFALRHASKFKNGKIDFLDSYMRKTTTFKQEDIDFLENIFSKTIELANLIYGEKLFKPFDINKQEWSNRSYKEYYDAVMVGCSYNLDNGGKLIQRKEKVIDATKILLSDKTNYKLFTGEGSTKAGVQKRIELFSQMLDRVAKD
jgi:Protein of unknown function DUF262